MNRTNTSAPGALRRLELKSEIQVRYVRALFRVEVPFLFFRVLGSRRQGALNDCFTKVLSGFMASKLAFRRYNGDLSFFLIQTRVWPKARKFITHIVLLGDQNL